MRQVNEDFEAFWAAYPKRPGNPKAPARKEWERLSGRYDFPRLEVMIECARRYAAHCAKDARGPEFIAHTRTWLFQERWRDWQVEGQQRLPEAPGQAKANLEPDGSWRTEGPWLVFRKEVGEQVWKWWFNDLTFEQGVLTTRSKFDRDYIDQKYGDRLCKLIPNLLILSPTCVRRRFIF
jgi:hypothetical protein